MKKISAKVKSIIEKAGYGVVSTLEDDQPRARPMIILLIKAGKIWLSTFMNSKKVEQIKKNPKVEICCVDPFFSHVRIEGVATVDKASQDLKRLWKKAPFLKEVMKGPKDPHLALIEVIPQTIYFKEIPQEKKYKVFKF
jgi:general stress protein 26